MFLTYVDKPAKQGNYLLRHIKYIYMYNNNINQADVDKQQTQQIPGTY